MSDYLLWYAKSKDTIKFRDVFAERTVGEGTVFTSVQLPDGTRRAMTQEERAEPKLLPKGSRVFGTDNLVSSGYTATCIFPIDFDGRTFNPTSGKSWKTNRIGIEALRKADRLSASGKTLRYLTFVDDYPVMKLSNLWTDTKGESKKVFVVQTSTKIIERCMLMTTDPGDLVFDPTCGSGTTAYVAEQWGRRWITCDTSRVALTLAKQRLMTAVFDYYELKHPDEGVGSGFEYKTVPHVTLKSIANNPDIKGGMTREQIDAAIARHAPQETLYDQPFVDRKRKRVSGPFTAEAVPAPAVKSVDSVIVDSGQWAVDSKGKSTSAKPSTIHDPQTAGRFADASVARSGETLRQGEWRDELLRAGIRGKAGQRIRFARLEPLPGCRWLHADGETRPNDEGADCVRETGPASEAQRIVVSFGPEHAPLEQRQVEHAWEEARTLAPRPVLLLFAAFQFDPEAAKDIDELTPEKAGMQLLKVQMNADLLTDDLKKKRASNESFWLIGQPDVEVNSEWWIVNSGKEALAAYDIVAELSGVDSLAKINGLDRDDLSLFIAIAQRRDLWDALAIDEGGGVGSGQHRRGAGAARDGRISAFPGGGAGLVGRIGDAADFVREVGLLSAKDRRSRLERLRGSREIADRARQIAPSLTGKLSSIHYSQVTIHGFDYYNTKTGDIESGGEDKIAVWMLDTDYDGRSLYPRQVFFPMAGAKEGWARLAKNLKAEIDEERIEAYRGTTSLPFEPGDHRRIAVKIVDDRGIESLKIVPLELSQGEAG